MAYSSKGSIALTTKLRAMHGKRLTQQNYRDLLRKQSVTEIAAYLKQQTFYSDIMHDINENSVHRGQLESVLRKQLFADYTKMLYYVGQNEIKFYNFFILHMEIEEILSCIRALNAGHQNEYIFSLPSYIAKHAKFDLYGLAKVKTYDDLLNILKATPFLDILKKFDPNNENKLDMVRVENEFNKYYYSFLLKIIDQNFTGITKERIEGSFGIQIDLENISQIMRLKKYFNVKSDYIKTLLLPFYCKINKNELNTIIEAPDAEQAMQALMQTKYGRLFEPYSFDYIDKYAQQVIYDNNKKLLAFSDSSAVSVVSYLQLKRTEINNIISIIEGVRYNLNPSEIEKILTGTAD
jgi:V/A-type H+-transporting ATPase subunit C